MELFTDVASVKMHVDIGSLMNNLIEDFISLKINHIRSYGHVFCTYFLIVAHYSVYSIVIINTR